MLHFTSVARTRAAGMLLILSCFAGQLLGQNVGIGTPPSAFQLDVKGRARIRHANSQTAGIYFDGTSAPTQAFIGMYTNDFVGFYSSTTSWQLGVNVNNGYVGFGTMAPTADLDINGDFRWRGSNPQANAVLMSTDALGNAKWQRPVAFGVSGTPDLANITFSNTNTWTKLYFRTTADYNLGFGWQVINSLFEAPAKGVYRFNLHLQHANDELGSQIRLIRRRAGINYVVAVQEFIGFANTIRVASNAPLDLHLDLLMEPFDQVWVELNPGFIYSAVLLGAERYYNFSGRLLFLQ